MKIHGQFTADDIIAFKLLDARFKHRYVGVIAIIAPAVIMFSGRLPERSLASCLIAFFPSAVLVCLPLAYNYFLMPHQVRRQFRDSKLGGVTEYEFTENSFRICDSRVTAELPWSDFQRVVVAEHMILLYRKSGVVHLCPRRWFTDEQYTEFKGYLQSALSKRKSGSALP